MDNIKYLKVDVETLKLREIENSTSKLEMTNFYDCIIDLNVRGVRMPSLERVASLTLLYDAKIVIKGVMKMSDKSLVNQVIKKYLERITILRTEYDKFTAGTKSYWDANNTLAGSAHCHIGYVAGDLLKGYGL